MKRNSGFFGVFWVPWWIRMARVGHFATGSLRKDRGYAGKNLSDSSIIELLFCQEQGIQDNIHLVYYKQK
jgi:hypothetical protein